MSCYEYQGSKNDKPEGIWHNLTLWDKTAEIFAAQNPEEGDQVSFNGSLVDESFDGKEGRVTRVGVRVTSIQLSRQETNDQVPF